MNESTRKRLARFVADKLFKLERRAARSTEKDYDSVLERLARKAPLLQAQTERNQARARERYADLADQPSGRQATVLENAQPAMLLALTYDLMRRSYGHRFGNTQRSLELAKLACRAAESVAKTDYLSEHSSADLLGEAFDHLGNARRITSDLAGAERAFSKAAHWLEQGTRDRSLRAFHLGLKGALRHTQGQAREAARLLESEIRLRRLLDDQEKLGAALVNRGLIACCTGEPLSAACKFVREGVELVEEHSSMFLGLLSLAETFAREGRGVEAWKLLCMNELVGGLVELGEVLKRRQGWVKGLTYRALGELGAAEKHLLSTRRGFIKREEQLNAAFVSLDLLAVFAAQDKPRELVALAQSTYQEFLTAKLEQPALSVFLILHRAAVAERLTEELAIRVANFIVRYQFDRSARFEGPEV